MTYVFTGGVELASVLIRLVTSVSEQFGRPSVASTTTFGRVGSVRPPEAMTVSSVVAVGVLPFGLIALSLLSTVAPFDAASGVAMVPAAQLLSLENMLMPSRI